MGSNNAYMPCSNLKMPNYDMKVVFHGSNNIEQLQAWIAAARTYAKWYEANMTEPQRVALLLSTLKDGAQVWASLLLTAEPGAFRTVEELITKLMHAYQPPNTGPKALADLFALRLVYYHSITEYFDAFRKLVMQAGQFTTFDIQCVAIVNGLLQEVQSQFHTLDIWCCILCYA